LFFLTHGVIFSIGNGQPRERALCQLYRHTFVSYSRRPLHETTRQSSGDRMDCRYRKVDASVVATNVRHGSAHYLRAIRNQGELGSTRHLGAFSWDHCQKAQLPLCATVHRCLQHKAPQYMTDCCIHTSDIARRQHLRSAGSHQLFVPRHRRSMFRLEPFLWPARRPGTRYQYPRQFL